MKSVVLISLILVSAFASQTILREQVEMSEKYTLKGEAAETKTLALQIFVKQQNLDKLEEILYAVSDPRSPQYGQHLTIDEITEIVEPTVESLDAIFSWLSSHGVEDIELNANRDIISTIVPVKTMEAMLSTKYQTFQHNENGNEITRCLEYSLPVGVSEHIDIVAPTVRFPAEMGTTVSANADGIEVTPKEIRSLYNIGDYKSTHADNSIGLCGFLGQYFKPGYLKKFSNKYDSEVKSREVTIVGENGSKNGIEANLDMQYGMALSTGVQKNWFWSTAGEQPDYPGEEPFLKWMQDVSSASDTPLVFSISYSDDEDKVNHDYAKRCNSEFQKMGARGISVLEASGDGGVEGTNMRLVCTKFIPTFPSASPYVTAVGGTSYKTPEVAAAMSSGGFSDYWTAPDYQKSFISTYKKNAASTLPNATMWNHQGAGFPDVSAQALNCMIYNVFPMPASGTSCSSPVFAGIVALLNNERLQAGKSSLGWLNPLFYQHPEMFNDITKGNNPGCGYDGFYCAEGWDPVTGLGTPAFDKMLEVVKSLK